MDQNMAFWNYADPANRGLADTTLRVSVDHALIPHVTLSGFAEYSMVVDSDLRDWFDVLGLDPDQVYAGVGVRWSY